MKVFDNEPMFINTTSLVPGAEEERLVHTDALPVK